MQDGPVRKTSNVGFGRFIETDDVKALFGWEKMPELNARFTRFLACMISQWVHKTHSRLLNPSYSRIRPSRMKRSESSLKKSRYVFRVSMGKITHQIDNGAHLEWRTVYLPTSSAEHDRQQQKAKLARANGSLELTQCNKLTEPHGQCAQRRHECIRRYMRHPLSETVR